MESDKFIIRVVEGKGEAIFAHRDLAIGETIGCFEGVPVAHPTKYSLTLDGVIVDPSGSLKFLNHSCTANSFFSGRILKADRDIPSGEEITIDYLATEKEISNGFLCRCGSDYCRGRIGNF